MRYSNERKQAVLAKLSPPYSRPIAEIATECVFQPKPATDSTAKLPPVPRQSCHRFQ